MRTATQQPGASDDTGPDHRSTRDLLESELGHFAA